MTAYDYVILGLLVASVTLHFIAPKTKSLLDDHLADVADVVRDALIKAQPSAPPAPAPTPPTP